MAGFFQTDYAFDQVDRLTKVKLFVDEAAPTHAQARVFTYSGAGFLTSSDRARA